ncbi:hypothetical protein V2A60_008612 [Cordyceps javanica]
MDHLHKLYTAVVRRRRGAGPQLREDASPPQLEPDSSDASTAEDQELPRQPGTPHLARRNFFGSASGDDSTDKPHKLARLAKLGALTNVVSLGGDGGSLAPSSRPNLSKHGQNSELLNRFLALPPELQFRVLSYLDFGDLERLRRTCSFFHTNVSPQLVRRLLHPNFHHHIRFTCRICLKQHWGGAGALVSTDKFDSHFPLSSRCVECVWNEKGFDVGKKYLMANNVAVFVCRWCGRPVTTQPAWNQPEFHKKCFKRYTQVVFLYYLIGLAQWVVVFVASGMCWRYFRTRALWVVGIVAAGFVVTLWNFCLNSLRGTLMRTYHFALLLESLIFASWLAPLLELFRINRQHIPYRAMDSYETATVVFIIFNMICRGINIVGNSILVCEYKLWRHKKPQMSPARSAWIHTIELFVFFVEPQCVEQEYPATWWFSRRRPVPPPEEDIGPRIVGVQPGVEVFEVVTGDGGHLSVFQ